MTAWNQGVQVLVVDSDGEYQPIADAVGGTTLHLGAPGVHLNSLDLGIEPDALTRRALFCHTLSRRRVWCWTGRDRRLHHQGHHQRPRTNTRPASLLSDLTHALDQDPDPAGAALAARLTPSVTGSFRAAVRDPEVVKAAGHVRVTGAKPGLEDDLCAWVFRKVPLFIKGSGLRAQDGPWW